MKRNAADGLFTKPSSFTPPHFSLQSMIYKIKALYLSNKFFKKIHTPSFLMQAFIRSQII
jgi:hypothetical protein